MMLSMSAVARVLGVSRPTAIQRLKEAGVPFVEATGKGQRHRVALSDLRKAFPDIADECNQARMLAQSLSKQLSEALERITALEVATFSSRQH